MLSTVAKGLLGRLLVYAGFALGFWLLYQGISRPHPLLGVLGGASLLGTMYLMVVGRRSGPAHLFPGSAGEEEEDPGDSLDGGGQGGKLPP
jgi:hypothetical protein|tara:strand:+ start:182 stop:454 length:273 start_codon:yes stop_codon:yes gene_type:complete